MRKNAGAGVRTTTKFVVLGLSSVAAATAFAGLGMATASAEVTEMAPRPNVTSRQAQIIDQNALRRTASGEARGALADNRSAGEGTVRAGNGAVKDSIKAVPGTRSSPFNLNRNGTFVQYPPIGSW